MKAVYVCHPYSGDPRGNVARVTRIARRLARHGYLPLAPHLYFPAFMNEKRERGAILYLCSELVKRADEVWVYGEKTHGMTVEVGMAAIEKKPIRWLTRDGRKRG
jgi:dienelactone hydrolase